tara:strand:+ start:1245 stop:1889 length:645 start_codon:yes stop_codon:yes gene_type:complete
MITKGKLTDQILRLYTGGNASDDKEISRDDINVLVGQVINRLLKTEHITGNMATNEMFPPHVLVTSYLVPVFGVDEIANMHYSHIKLPVFPISLPRNMGVWSITDSACTNEYIPIQTGQYSLMNVQDQLRYLEGQVAYWAEGNIVNFSEDIKTGSDKVTKVRVSLLIVDPTVIGEYDYLALPAEMEESVIKEVLTILGALPKTVDKVSDSNNQL